MSVTTEDGIFGQDPFHGHGKIILQFPNKIVWECVLDDGTHITCVQELTEPYYEANRERLNDSAGQRWGDGKVVARIPLPVFYDTILPAQKAGDEKWIKKFLNNSDNRKFRTFGGDL